MKPLIMKNIILKIIYLPSVPTQEMNSAIAMYTSDVPNNTIIWPMG